MKVAFYTPHLCLRGTTVAVYDYAKFNQDILGNESIVIYDEKDSRNDNTTLAKFTSSFKTIASPSSANIAEVDRILAAERADAVYIIKGGSPNDGLISRTTKSLIHAVGMTGPENKHGDVWAYASFFLKNACAKNSDIPVVPHMAHLPEVNEDMREHLGIPKQSLVFGRTGGLDTWNIPFANRVIYDVVNRRNDVFFLFQNTHIPFQHERIIHIPTTSDLAKKTKFINTCNAMVHARVEGESFGLACAEFSLRNKPIITWGGSSERSHLEILGEKAHVYHSPIDLFDLIVSFERKFDDYNCYREYSPDNIIRMFEKVFLK